MLKNINESKRFKMYKAGKKWLFAGIAAMGLGTVSMTAVSYATNQVITAHALSIDSADTTINAQMTDGTSQTLNISAGDSITQLPVGVKSFKIDLQGTKPISWTTTGIKNSTDTTLATAYFNPSTATASNLDKLSAGSEFSLASNWGSYSWTYQFKIDKNTPSTPSQGPTWGTAPYIYDASTGTLTVTGPGTLGGNAPWTQDPAVRQGIKKIVFQGQISLPADSSQLFDGLMNLTEIDGLDKLDTSNVTDMSEMFAGDTSLPQLDISSFDTSKVTDMFSMFQQMPALTTLKGLGNSSLASLKTGGMASMLNSTPNLTTIELGNNVSAAQLSQSQFTPNPDVAWYPVDAKNNVISGKTVFKNASDLFSGADSVKPATYTTKPSTSGTGTPSNPGSSTGTGTVTPSNPGTGSTGSGTGSASTGTIGSPSNLGTGSTGSTSTGAVTPSNPVIPVKPSTPSLGTVQKKMAVIMNKGGYLYKTSKLGKTDRIYYKAGTRQQRPMFVVDSIVKVNGKTLYKVHDVNAKFVNSNKKTNGKKGYIIATKNVVPAYYSTKNVKYFKVINKRGINGYKNVSLTSRAKHYKYGAILRVTGQKAHNLTMRYKLSNGNYISANKKLVEIYK